MVPNRNNHGLCAITGNGLYKRRDGVEVKLEWDAEKGDIRNGKPAHWSGSDGYDRRDDGAFCYPPYHLDIVELIKLDEPTPEPTPEPEPVVVDVPLPNEVFGEQEEAEEPEDIGIQRLQAARHLIELYGGEYSIAAKAVKSAAWMYAKV